MAGRLRRTQLHCRHCGGGGACGRRRLLERGASDGDAAAALLLVAAGCAAAMFGMQLAEWARSDARRCQAGMLCAAACVCGVHVCPAACMRARLAWRPCAAIIQPGAEGAICGQIFA